MHTLKTEMKNIMKDQIKRLLGIIVIIIRLSYTNINLIWNFEETGKYRWKGRLILSPQLLIFSIQVELLILVTYMSLAHHVPGFPLHEQQIPPP